MTDKASERDVADRNIQHWLLDKGYANLVINGNEKPYVYVSDAILAREQSLKQEHERALSEIRMLRSTLDEPNKKGLIYGHG